MTNIEKSPLPPPGGATTTITGADRAEIMAQAAAVLDYYLNGQGSYYDAGPQKSLDATLADLQNFYKDVLALQFGDVNIQHYDPEQGLVNLIDYCSKGAQAVSCRSAWSDMHEVFPRKRVDKIQTKTKKIVASNFVLLSANVFGSFTGGQLI